MTVRDAREAIAMAEGALSQRLLLSVDGIDPPATNVFGDRVVVEHGRDVATLVRRATELTAAGERVAVVATVGEVSAARSELWHVAARRLGIVVHCVEGPGAQEPPGETGGASALSLGDLPWGMLVAVGAAESLDLSLVARRAAEDSGCPFFVVHEGFVASDQLRSELLVPPTREMGNAFLGGPRPSAPPDGDLRAIAQRAPFALASALREVESLSVRRLDVLERAPSADAPLSLVGVGAVGASLLAEIPRLRSAGHDVAAIRVVAWRPFPGPRLIKALSRAIAVSVVDSVDRPLSNGGPLGLELKASFSDALTWAPGYPGIGRIPRVVLGVCPKARTLAASDVDILVESLVGDERGERTIVLGRMSSAS